jgi:prepilin-type N-terminal cleavage/methylation domain-containing protein
MKQKSAFTLAELSVVLVIIALVIGMAVSSGVTTISAARYSATLSKMAALEQALMAFRVANNRLPCPSDLSQVQGSATYGTEGACTAIAGGVSVATNSNGTATAAEGGVPTAALGLPSDLMYDGYGERFRYAVDTRMTSPGAFYLMQAGCVNGPITVYGGPNYPATGNTTGAIYALVSHGANGHGAVTKNATVYNAGSLNADEQTNCHCTSTGAAGTYAPTYVQLDPYTYQAIGQANSLYNFDDMVTYKERWQMQTTWDKVGTNCAGGAFSRAITINSSYVSTVNHTNLTNFPVLFSGTYSYLATQANGGNVTNANGYDITFTSDAAGAQLLPFERESYNASTGTVNFWVNVPVVSGSANTTIYLWYDNPSITTDQSNKTGTWDSNYKGVWHLPNGTTLTANDSTSNTNNGTITNATAATGRIDGAASFNGSSAYINAGNGSSINITGDGTVEAWVYTTSYAHDSSGYDRRILYNNINNTNVYQLTSCPPADCNGSNEFDWVVNDSTGQHDAYANNAGAGYSINTWYHLVGTYTASSHAVTLYVNGSSASITDSVSGWGIPPPGGLYFGQRTDGLGRFPGNLDEVRASNTARSPDWIVTEYNNQNSPSTFYTVGSAVTTR